MYNIYNNPNIHKENMNRLITLLASFTLSTIAYLGAQKIDDVKVQHIEFTEPFVIQPRVEEIVFGDYVIAQVDESDDGDGENIDWMNDNWCLIHPDDPICVDKEDDEDYGC